MMLLTQAHSKVAVGFVFSPKTLLRSANKLHRVAPQQLTADKER